ncbi:hypothetical protein [Winogradskyella sp. UBA3174]|uniref:hypothetical protein n=1 Tax=Winogradskyella sp. UBA3174 TaxID=1947785 RepID=UPI0025DA17AF|nr:hypothetical protein [Winogradskyella sp. UBA3174]|tara:strand:- start:32067 stop:32243 length:177 start_codon:yes stop_codon:yes gene_type:complete
MNQLIIILQEVDINKKLAEAPDDSYEVGLFIGAFLPFVILVIIAFVIYRYNKNRIKDE